MAGLEDILGRLEAVERRLADLERATGSARPAPPAGEMAESRPMTTEEPAAHRREETQPTSVVEPGPAEQPSAHGPGDEIIESPIKTQSPPLGEPTAAPPNGRIQPGAPSTALAARPTREPINLEWFIGGRLFLVMGAIVVVIAVGLFLKLAYDSGWFRMPPSIRCIAGAAFGLALIGTGEFVRRRVGSLASAGLWAAGLGSIYTSAWASYGFYELVHPAAAFAMLAATAALGIALGAIARVVLLTAVSLVAGYLAPIVLGTPPTEPWVFPSYLTALLVVGLSLSAWIRGRFVVLRGVVWWFTVGLGSLWVVTTTGEAYEAFIALCFIALVWTAVHAELIVEARGRTLEPLSVLRLDQPMRWKPLRPLLTTFGTTAWSAGLAVGVIRLTPGMPTDWLSPGMGAVASIIAWQILAGHLRVLREPPRTEAERLGATLAMQAGGLLLFALALGLAGWTEAIGWLALGVSSAAAGRWIGSRGVVVYGLVALVIGTLRVMLYDSMRGLASPELEIAGLVLSRWMALAAGTGLAWLVAAGTVRRNAGAWRGIFLAMICIGATTLHIALWHEHAESFALTFAAMLLGAAMMMTSHALHSTAIFTYAGSILVIASCWTFFGERLAMPPWQTSLGGIVVSRWTLLPLLSAAAWSMATRLACTRGGSAWDSVSSWCFVAAAAHVFAVLLHDGSEAAWIAPVFLALGVACSFFTVLPETLPKRTVGFLGVLGAGLGWLLAFVPDWKASTSPIFLHPGLVQGLLIAPGIVVTGWRLRPESRDDGQTRAIRSTAGALACGLLLAATSLETARVAGTVTQDATAQKAALSIWWGVFSVALIVGGLLRRVPIARYAGLALLAFATVRALVLIWGDITPIWRIVSLGVVGLLTLGVSVGYLWIAQRFTPSEPQTEPGQSPPAA